MNKLFDSLAMLLLAASVAWAQGVIKDDFVRDAATGNGLGGLTVRVCSPGALGVPCNPTAPIWSNIELTSPISNSEVTTSSMVGEEGRYTFYARPGRYLIQVLQAGIERFHFDHVVLANDPSGNVTTAGPSPWLHRLHLRTQFAPACFLLAKLSGPRTLIRNERRGLVDSGEV